MKKKVGERIGKKENKKGSILEHGKRTPSWEATAAGRDQRPPLTRILEEDFSGRNTLNYQKKKDEEKNRSKTEGRLKTVL